MGFFTGLLPGAMSSRTSLVSPPETGSNGSATLRDGSPSPSPVNLHAPRSYHHSQRPSLPHRNTTPFSHHHHHHHHHNSHPMQKQSSRSSLHLQAIQQQHFNMVSPRSPRTSAYVQHVASASSIPSRPNSTPAHITRPAIFVTDNDHDSSSTQPPLPPTWLESVARAVLFGGTGAYIGGPSSYTSHHESLGAPSSPLFSKPHVLRSTRSSLSQVSSRRSKHHRQPNRRSGLSDQTNSPITPTSGSRDTFFGPPSLFSQIERGRSRRSEGEVSKTRVVCRSAPGSRSGSVTRSGGGGNGNGNGNSGGGERSRKRERTRRKEEKGRLPSLARTQAEGDVWDQDRKNEGVNNHHVNRYLSGWNADAHSEAGSSASSEEEDDGELDLARILVPPKRQNSIKSLRKHLTAASENAGVAGHGAYASLKYHDARAGRENGGGGGDGSGGNRIPRILQRRKMADGEDWDGESQEEWGGGWVRKGAAAGNRESEDDSFVGFGFFGEGRTNLAGTSSSKKNRNGSGATTTNRLGFRGLMGGGGSTS